MIPEDPSDDAIEAGARALADTILGEDEYERMRPWEQALYRTAMANALEAVKDADKPKPLVKKWNPPSATAPPRPGRNGRKPPSIAWDACQSQLPDDRPDPLGPVVERLVELTGLSLDEFRDTSYPKRGSAVTTARRAVWRWMSRRGANAGRLAVLSGVTRAAVSSSVRKVVEPAESALLARFDAAKEEVLDGEG